MWNWFTALLWERWRRTAPVFLAMSITAMALGFMALGSRDRGIRDICEIFTFYAAVTLLVFLLFVQSSMNDLRLGLSACHFRLPISVARLMLAHYFFAACAIFGFFALAFSAMLVQDIPEYHLDVVLYAGLSFLIFLFAQTLSWIVGPVSTVAAIFIVPAMTLFGVGITFGVFRNPEIVEILLYPWVLIGACLFLSLLALHGQRIGVLAPLNPGTLRDFFTMASRRNREFASPLEAQAYYEWKRRGRFLPLLFVATAFPAVLISLVTPEVHYALWDDGYSLRHPMELLETTISAQRILLLSCALAASLIAVAFAHRDRVAGVLTFIHTKPVTTSTLARARTWAIWRGTAWTLGFLLLALLPAFFLDTPDLHESVYFDARSAFIRLYAGTGALILLTFLGFGLAAWTTFNLGAALLFASFYLVASGLLLNGAGVLFGAPPDWMTLNDFFEVAVVLVAVTFGTIVPFVLLLYGRRKGWITTRALGTLLALLPLLALFVVGAASLGSDLSWRFYSDEIIFIAALAPLAVLPFTAWPMFIAWQRHKR